MKPYFFKIRFNIVLQHKPVTLVTLSLQVFKLNFSTILIPNGVQKLAQI